MPTERENTRYGLQEQDGYISAGKSKATKVINEKVCIRDGLQGSELQSGKNRRKYLIPMYFKDHIYLFQKIAVNFC